MASIATLAVQLVANTAPFTKGMQGATKSVEGLRKSTQMAENFVGGITARLGAAVSVGVVATAAFNKLRESFDAVEQLNDMSAALGASVLRSAAQAADRVVMAAVDGVSLDGVTWTPMRVVLPGDDDPTAGTVGIQTMPWGTVWACAEAATGFAREAAALVASFRQRAAGAPADR